MDPVELLDLLESGDYERSFHFGRNASKTVRAMLSSTLRLSAAKAYIEQCAVLRVEPHKQEIRKRMDTLIPLSDALGTDYPVGTIGVAIKNFAREGLESVVTTRWGIPLSLGHADVLASLLDARVVFYNAEGIWQETPE